MQKNATYALYGGSFDPPHLGHLEIVKRVLELKEVDKVLIVPTYLNPFKTKFAVKPELRLNWVKEQFNLENVEISSFEIEQKRAVYTVETFKELSKRYNIKYIVIGADNLKSLKKWRDFDYLNKKITWIIATRANNKLNLEGLKRYILLNINIDVSSSEIREGKKLNFLYKKIKPQVLLEYNLNNFSKEDSNEQY